MYSLPASVSRCVNCVSSNFAHKSRLLPVLHLNSEASSAILPPNCATLLNKDLPATPSIKSDAGAGRRI